MSSIMSASTLASPPSTCKPVHDPVSMSLSIFLSFGLIISYLPQIVRIVRNRSSLGFSPWFLLLGATSSASSFLNIVALQWGLVRCCSHMNAGACAESMLGIVQVGLQWFMFIVILILFLVYYPQELRYEHSISLSSRQRRSRSQNNPGLSTNSSSPSTSSLSSEEDREDLDSLDSHIVNNYSTFSQGQTPNESGMNLPPNAISGTSGGVPPKGLAARLKKQEREEAASSSAFSRLVPTFWPVWKAPGAQPDEDASAFTINNDSSYVGTPNAFLHSGNGAPASISGTPMANGETRSLLGATGASASAFARSGGNALLAPLLKAKHNRRTKSTKQRTPEWSLALGMAWVTGIHFVFILAVTLLLVSSLPDASFPTPSILSSSRFISYLSPSSSPFPRDANGLFHSTMHSAPTTLAPSSRLLVSRWATFLGVSGAALAAAQYIPQIIHTANAKLVGSLSVHMMLLQVPGSAIFVYSLAIRPGTDWTSLVAFICTGVLQLVLLILCFAWKLRQKRAGIDDFGRPLPTQLEEERAIGDS